MVTSADFVWTDEPGLLLVKRWIRRHPLPVRTVRVDPPPRIFVAQVRLEKFLGRDRIAIADPSFPLILFADGNGDTLPLDGSHRLYRAYLEGRTTVPSIRLPTWFGVWFLIAGPIYLAEGLYLGIRYLVRSIRRGAVGS